MKVAVGSKNPVKIQVVREVCEGFFDEFELISLDAPSGVSEMPFGNEESIRGARNRAQFCLDNSDAELAFGLEGYVKDLEEGMFLSGWCVAMNREGKTGIGSKGTIRLPKKIAERVRNGEELGPVMDDVMNEKDTKKTFNNTAIVKFIYLIIAILLGGYIIVKKYFPSIFVKVKKLLTL